jgi:hypothetical protein
VPFVNLHESADVFPFSHILSLYLSLSLHLSLFLSLSLSLHLSLFLSLFLSLSISLLSPSISQLFPPSWQERKELLQQYLDQLLSCSELAESIPVKFFLIPHAAGPITDAFYSSKTMLEVCGKGKPWGIKQHRKGGFMSISMVRGARLSAGSSASSLASPASASGSATCSPLSALKRGVEIGRADAREEEADVAGVKSVEQDEGEMGDDAGGTTTGQVVSKDGQGDEGNVEGAGKMSDSGVTLNDEADASGRDSPEAAPRHASHVHSASNGHDTIVNEDDQGDCSRGTGPRISSHQGFMTGPKGVHVSAGEVSDALLALVDELLELGGRGWLRRRTHSLMLLLLNVTSYDLSIEAHILGIVESACGEASLSRMLRCLRELCWPGGGPLCEILHPKTLDAVAHALSIWAPCRALPPCMWRCNDGVMQCELRSSVPGSQCDVAGRQETLSHSMSA